MFTSVPGFLGCLIMVVMVRICWGNVVRGFWCLENMGLDVIAVELM